MSRPLEFDSHRERWCVWAIYGAPVLLAPISLSVVLMLAFRMSPFPLRNLDDVILAVNAVLAGLIPASGEVLRRGSLTRRVASGLLYCIIGFVLYYLLLMLMAFVFQLRVF